MQRIGIEPPEYLKKLNVHHISMAQGQDALDIIEEKGFDPKLLRFNVDKDTFVEVSWGDGDNGIADYAQWTFGHSIPLCISATLNRTAQGLWFKTEKLNVTKADLERTSLKLIDYYNEKECKDVVAL